MVDHIRTLLINPSDAAGYTKVSDSPADTALTLFGIYGKDSTADATVVDRVMPLVMAEDLSSFRRFFDSRETPRSHTSIYRTSADGLSPDGLYAAVCVSGWWQVLPVFRSADPLVSSNLQDMHVAARSSDAPFALGAILIACAYRRLLLQENT